jgi:hypothetical protein
MPYFVGLFYRSELFSKRELALAPITFCAGVSKRPGRSVEQRKRQSGEARARAPLRVPRNRRRAGPMVAKGRSNPSVERASRALAKTAFH